MVTDLRTGEVIADSSRKGALASVNDAPGDGLRASYRLPGTRYAVRRDGDELGVRASLGRSIASLPGRSRPWIELDLILRERGHRASRRSPRWSTASESSVSVTAKTAGMAVDRSASWSTARAAAGRTASTAGSVGTTTPRACCPGTPPGAGPTGPGDSTTGPCSGFNIVEGFSGVGERSRENAVWIDGRPTALDARTRFEFDRGDVMRPWRITTADGTVRLRFDPVAAHDEFLDVKAAAQPVHPTGRALQRRDRRRRGGPTSSTGCRASSRTRTSSGSDRSA